MVPPQGLCICCSLCPRSSDGQLLPVILASTQVSHPKSLPWPPYLKCLCCNPHTLSHCAALFSSTYPFQKLSYLYIWLFTNCLSPNFNESRGLVSPVPALSPALNKGLMNEVREGSRAQGPILFSRRAAVGPGASDLSSLGLGFPSLTCEQQDAEFTFKEQPVAGQEARLGVLTACRSWHRMNSWMNKCLCFVVCLSARSSCHGPSSPPVNGVGLSGLSGPLGTGPQSPSTQSGT